MKELDLFSQKSINEKYLDVNKLVEGSTYSDMVCLLRGFKLKSNGHTDYITLYLGGIGGKSILCTAFDVENSIELQNSLKKFKSQFISISFVTRVWNNSLVSQFIKDSIKLTTIQDPEIFYKTSIDPKALYEDVNLFTSKRGFIVPPELINLSCVNIMDGTPGSLLLLFRTVIFELRTLGPALSNDYEDIVSAFISCINPLTAQYLEVDRAGYLGNPLSMNLLSSITDKYFSSDFPRHINICLDVLTAMFFNKKAEHYLAKILVDKIKGAENIINLMYLSGNTSLVEFNYKGERVLRY